MGRDLARVLAGAVHQGRGLLEGQEHVITWAVGHLVELAEPDAYDPKLKKWRYADLPIVPERFKLVARDERSKKQMNVVHRQIGRDDVDAVVNACDAGREGELIFAYLYETAGPSKPVQRLWLTSMTKRAIKRRLRRACGRRGDGAARGRPRARAREADWIVGMNATRAATIRLRSSFDGAVSLGRVQTPTLAILARREEEIRAFKPEPYWLVEANFAADRRPRATRAATSPAPSRGSKTAEEADGDRRGRPRASPARSPSSRRSERKERAPLLYDLTSLQRDANTRYGFSRAAHAGRGPAAVRGAQGAHLPAHELALPDRRHGAPRSSPRPSWSATTRVRKAPSTCSGSTCCRSARVVDDKKVTDHHAIIPTRSEHDRSTR